MIIDISKDKKGPSYTITKTDCEGFHHQLSVTLGELTELRHMADVIIKKDLI